jgi:hypothetical protein
MFCCIRESRVCADTTGTDALAIQSTAAHLASAKLDLIKFFERKSRSYPGKKFEKLFSSFFNTDICCMCEDAQRSA